MSETYSLKPVPGKGLGLVASIDIKAGMRILTDRALFTIGTQKDIGANIRAALDLLSIKQQQQYMGLHCPDRKDFPPIVSRWLANAFSLAGGNSGIFPKAARINHSCCPNAHIAWNSNLQQKTVHAIVDIPRGEEITISYVHKLATVAERQNIFRYSYCFQCDCPACRPGNEIREQNIAKMRPLIEVIQDYHLLSRESDDRELKVLAEFIKLANTENIQEPYVYERASMVYEARGDLVSATKYADMQVEMEMRMHGSDHPETIRSLQNAMSLHKPEEDEAPV